MNTGRSYRHIYCIDCCFLLLGNELDTNHGEESVTSKYGYRHSPLIGHGGALMHTESARVDDAQPDRETDRIKVMAGKIKYPEDAKVYIDVSRTKYLGGASHAVFAGSYITGSEQEHRRLEREPNFPLLNKAERDQQICQRHQSNKMFECRY